MLHLRRALLALAVAVPALLLSISPASAKTLFPACAMIVSTNTTLSHNLTTSGQNGVCIVADNVKLNLNGHTITGGGGAQNYLGVSIFGYANVEVKNGTIANFDTDVYVDSASNVNIHSLTLTTDGNYYGVYDWQSSGTIVKNVRCANAWTCVGLDGNDFNEGPSNDLITGNTDVGSVYPFWDQYGTSNVFSKNTSTSAGDTAFWTGSTNADTFSKNSSKGIPGTTYGFYDDENSNGNSYVGNKATNGYYGWYLYGNDDDDIGPAGPFTLQGNTASGNTEDGFYTEYGFYYDCLCPSDAGSSFIGNTATNNGGNGFADYWSINSTWSGNKATGNGGNGIWIDYPQNDVITGNTTNGNDSTGFYLENNDPGGQYNVQSFTKNKASGNGDYGLYADYSVSGTGNKATGNSPFDCWNVSCQAGSSLASAPTRPVHSGAPVRRPHGPVRAGARHRA